MMLLNPFDVGMAAVVLGSFSVTVIAIARIWVRRLESRDRSRQVGAEVELRLQRIEQAVDAIAIEVERMSESQRFTSKVLADRLPPASALPRGHTGG